MSKRKPRVGRPPKGEHKRSVPAMTKFTKAEAETVDKKRNGQPLSAYLREKALS